MTLTLVNAKDIVSVVSGDIISRARITGPALGAFGRFVSAKGWAGGIRNAALLFGAWMHESDPVFQRVCCIGISEATRDALLDQHHRPKLSFVHSVNMCDRSPGGYEHHATSLWLKDGSRCVFDWFKTLDPDNPFIYRYADWLVDKNPVPFVNFRGF